MTVKLVEVDDELYKKFFSRAGSTSELVLRHACPAPKGIQLLLKTLLRGNYSAMKSEHAPNDRGFTTV
jgi:hypothetical protein